MVYHLYNLSQLSNLSSLNQLVGVTNTATNGVLVGMLIILIWVVILISLLRFDFVRALASASFVCFLLSGFLVFLGYLSIIYLLAFLLLTAIAGFIMYLE